MKEEAVSVWGLKRLYQLVVTAGSQKSGSARSSDERCSCSFYTLCLTGLFARNN